ncbi:hypothetical protein DL96DRAFT_216360 [Flagelloscypha sp. PMI_526]|nr:hypothetical protein DL96DRAFT_216360 [Flagelloscypha sp. PMI_526]
MAKFSSVDVGYFFWTPYDLSTFVLSIIFGIFTLCGGAWWIRVRCTPKAKASGVQSHLATVWTVWLFTILFYILTAFWSAASARVLALTLRSKTGRAFAIHSWRARLASTAFLSFSSAGWMASSPHSAIYLTDKAYSGSRSNPRFYQSVSPSIRVTRVLSRFWWDHTPGIPGTIVCSRLDRLHDIHDGGSITPTHCIMRFAIYCDHYKENNTL